MMIDYSRAYTATWRLYRVNPSTWADAQQVGRMLSASVTRSCEGDAPEIDSGSITVEGDPLEGFSGGYYRIAMTAEQSGEHERVDIATLLCESDGGSIARQTDRKSIAGFSVLHPAATTQVPDGTCVPKGTDGAQAAAALLRSAIQAPVEVDGAFFLADHYDFGFGDTVLECAWRLLRAGNFCIQTDGRGRVYIGPMPSEPSLTLDRASTRMLDPKISYALDLSDVPNRFIVKSGGMSAVAENVDGPNVGRRERGYWVDASESNPAMLEGETLQSYAERRLAEESVVLDERSYVRAWADLSPYDIVTGSMADAKLEGSMRIVSQDYSCGNSVKVTEKAVKEVRLWP